MMKLGTLLYTLLNFVANPKKSWGEPTSGDLSEGATAHVTIEQADRNSARLLSGTYTQEQHDDFQAQAAEVERNGSGTARFSGDPNNLPASIPERKCSKCSKTFRSIETDEDVRCYDCVVGDLCPQLPGHRIAAYWHEARHWEKARADEGYRDGWSLDVSGDIGFHNEMSFCWHNRNSSGNVCHQSLLVRRTAEGKIRELVFRTLAETAERCYTATFDVEANTVKFTVRKATGLCNWNETPETKVEKIDPIVVDLMVAMLPEWMLDEHRPKRSDVTPYPYYPEVAMA